jgi:hypothetical protein
MALERSSPRALPDRVVEADEMYQNAGEKGRPHPDPADPPRRRGHHFNGHGTFENDRPPNLAKVTLARKVSSIVLAMWKYQEVYDTVKHSKPSS